MNTWRDILEKASFPRNVLVLDFETYFDSEYHLGRDAKALSICEFIADMRFEILGFGYQILCDNGEELYRRFVPGPEVKGMIGAFIQEYGDNLERTTVVSKNAKFDMLILAEKFGIYPRYTVDVEDLTRTYEARMSHKLEDVAPVFGLKAKGDTSQFKGQHFERIDLAAMEEYCLNDVYLEVELFKRLMPIVSDPKRELVIAAHTLNLYLRPTLHFDFDLAAKLKADMTDQIDGAVKDAAEHVMRFLGMDECDKDDAVRLNCWHEFVDKALSGDISFAKMLVDALPAGEKPPTKPGKPSKNMIPITGEGKILALAKDDEGCKLLLNHKDGAVRALTIARMAVSSWPGHVRRVDNIESQAKASHGLVRVPLRYYGAHTGRWSGEEAVNLGNLGGAGRGKEINKLIGQVRHTLRAPPGCVLVLVDSAQVEARNVAWYADQSDLVDEFRNRGDPYSSLASDLFQTKVWKWRKSDVEEYPGQEKRITIYRGFGKDAILGCGYGMGAVKFHTRCLANDELRPHFDSGEYTEETTARVVETYRTKYRRIPEFWSLVERAWRIATKYHGKQIVGALEFWNEDGTTHMRLPSGRVMYYHTACVNARDELFSASCRSPTNVMGKLWGGHLTENIVQATCRDALRDWILMAEENGIHIVLHVYDEMIAVAAEDKAESVMKTMIEIMRTVPSWAEGMPFDAEGKISPYYTK